MDVSQYTCPHVINDRVDVFYNLNLPGLMLKLCDSCWRELQQSISVHTPRIKYFDLSHWDDKKGGS